MENQPRTLVFYSEHYRSDIGSVINKEIQERIKGFVGAGRIWPVCYSTYHVRDRVLGEGFQSGINWSSYIISINIVAVVLVSVNDACVLGIGTEVKDLNLRLYRYVDADTLELIKNPRMVGTRKVRLINGES